MVRVTEQDKEDFADFLQFMEKELEAHTPGLTPLEMMTVVSMTLFVLYMELA